MRIWTIHPQYLDPKGMVALWREALLAQAVLMNRTKGYRSHPQLKRFREPPDPVGAIGTYLKYLYDEALERGYHFSFDRIVRVRLKMELLVTRGQVQYEFSHLLRKLKSRAPALYEEFSGVKKIKVHPLFKVVPGPIEAWEVVKRSGMPSDGLSR